MLTVAVWATAYYTDAGYLRTELFLTLYCAMFVDILRRSWSTAPRDRIFVTTLTAGPVAYHVWSVVALTPHGLAFLIYLIAVTAIAVMLGVHARSTLVRLAAFVAVALPLGAWIEAHHWRGWVLTSSVAIVGIYAIHLAAQLRAVAGEHDDEFDGREVALLHANGVGVYVALYQVLIDTFSIGQFAALGVLWAFVNAAIWSVVRRTRPLPALHWLGVACTLTTAAVWLQFGGPWAVAIWATEGAVVLWIAVVSGSRWLRIGAWVLLALAAFRWGQSDIQQTTTAYVLLFNARALTGLNLVALLYFAAWKSAAQDVDEHRAVECQEQLAAEVTGVRVIRCRPDCDRQHGEPEAHHVQPSPSPPVRQIHRRADEQCHIGEEAELLIAAAADQERCGEASPDGDQRNRLRACTIGQCRRCRGDGDQQRKGQP
jgi:hypothetical protein